MQATGIAQKALGTPRLFRLAGLLAGLWGGVLLCIGFLAAPAGFATLPTAQAGRLAGEMLSREAGLSIGMCVILFLLARRHARQAAREEGASVLSANVLLVLGVLFCTVFGHFGLRPAMDAARAGQGFYSFGTLHAVSMAAFGLKTLLVLALAWRLPATPSSRLIPVPSS